MTASLNTSQTPSTLVSPSVAFLFPGQGSQSVGMGRELAAQYPEFRQTFEEASDALGLNMAQLCFDDPEKQLALTEFTQPAILTVSTGIARVLAQHAGVKFDVVAGHSLGEYSALVAAGALGFADAVKAVHFRGQAMQRAVPVGVGAMAAYLGSSIERVLEICRAESSGAVLKSEAAPTQGDAEVVEVVNFNSKGQLVLSGHKAAVERASKTISEEKLGRVLPLPVSAPFHSSLMQPAMHEMEKYLQKIQLRPLAGKIIANIDAKTYTGSEYGISALVRQIASPVLWTQSLAELQEVHRPVLWIEVGPGNVLQGLVKKTLEGCETLGTSDSASVANVLGRLSGL